jgi:hypothetical protein
MGRISRLFNPERLIHRVASIRQHPHLLKRGVYVAVVMALIGKGITDLLYTDDPNNIGIVASPFVIALMAGVASAFIFVGKDMVKSELSDDEAFIQLGLSKNKTTSWSLTTQKTILLVFAICFFAGEKLVFFLRADGSLATPNLVATCQIAEQVNTGHVRDKAEALRKIALLRQQANDNLDRLQGRWFNSQDGELSFASIGLLGLSEMVLLEQDNEPIRQRLAVASQACQTISK